MLVAQIKLLCKGVSLWLKGRWVTVVFFYLRDDKRGILKKRSLEVSHLWLDTEWPSAHSSSLSRCLVLVRVWVFVTFLRHHLFTRLVRWWPLSFLYNSMINGFGNTEPWNLVLRQVEIAQYLVSFVDELIQHTICFLLEHHFLWLLVLRLGLLLLLRFFFGIYHLLRVSTH